MIDYYLSFTKACLSRTFSLKRILRLRIGIYFLSTISWTVSAFTSFLWTQEELAAHCLETTEAVKDEVFQSLEELYKFLETQPINKYTDLRKILKPQEGPPSERWQSFQPEVYLKKLKGYDHEIYKDFLNNTEITLNHPYLKRTQNLIKILRDCNHLSARALACFYEKTLNNLIKATPKERKDLLDPPVRLILEGIPPYYVSQNMALLLACRSIFNYPQKENVTGNHLVISYQGLHYKVNGGLDPLTPSFETAFTLLGNLIGHTPLSPSSCLILLKDIKTRDIDFNAEFIAFLDEGKETSDYTKDPRNNISPSTKKSASYFLQASQTIEGKCFNQYLKGNSNIQSSEFDLFHFGLNIVLHLLAQPYDAKADNYIVRESDLGKQIIGIDNDKIFSPNAYILDNKKSVYPGIKCILFSLKSLMTCTIPNDLIDSISSLPKSLSWNFLYGLLNQRKIYNDFFKMFEPSPSTIQHKEWSSDRENFNIECLLLSGTLKNLLKKWIDIQEAILQPDIMTFEDLLQKIDPFNAFVYQRLYEKCSDPLKQMNVLYQENFTLDDIFPNISLRDEYININEIKNRDFRTKGRTQTLEMSFFEIFEEDIIKSYTILDKFSVLRVLDLIETNFSLNDLEEWNQRMKELKENSCDTENIFLKNFNFKLLSEFLNSNNDQELTPIDLIVKEKKSVKILEIFIKYGSYKVNKPENFVYYLLTQVNNFQERKNLVEKMRESHSYELMSYLWLINIELGFPRNTVKSNFPSYVDSDHIMRVQDEDIEFSLIKIKEIKEEQYSFIGRDFIAYSFYKLSGLHQIVGYPIFPETKILKLFSETKLSKLYQNLGEEIDDISSIDSFEKKNLESLIFLNLFLNPTSGMLSTFVKNNIGLSSICHDHIFSNNDLEDFSCVSRNIKTILFCLDTMKEKIHKDIVEVFKLINPRQFVDEWLRLINLHLQKTKKFLEKYNYSPKDTENILKSFKFNIYDIVRLYLKLYQTQKIFNTTHDNLTYLSLLEQIDPIIGKRYKFIIKNLTSIENRIKLIEKNDFEDEIKKFLKERNIKPYKIQEWLTQLNIIKHNYLLQNPTDIRDFLQEYYRVEDLINNENILEGFIDNDFFKNSNIYAPLIEIFLKKNGWDILNQDQQKKCIELMERNNYPFFNLNLKNVNLLTLGKFQKLNLNHLIELDASYCHWITNDFFPILSKNCMFLEILDISGNNNITSFVDVLMPYLKKITAVDCKNLKKLNIDVPSLEYINIPSLGLNENSLKNGKLKLNLFYEPWIDPDYIRIFFDLINLKSLESFYYLNYIEKYIPNIFKAFSPSAEFLYQPIYSCNIPLINHKLSLQTRYLLNSILHILLERLNFSYEQKPTEVINKLAMYPLWENIKDIDLESGNLDPYSFQKVFSDLKNIHRLNLKNNNLCCENILSLNLLEELRFLNLSNNDLGPSSIIKPIKNRLFLFLLNHISEEICKNLYGKIFNGLFLFLPGKSGSSIRKKMIKNFFLNYSPLYKNTNIFLYNMSVNYLDKDIYQKFQRLIFNIINPHQINDYQKSSPYELEKNINKFIKIFLCSSYEQNLDYLFSLVFCFYIEKIPSILCLPFELKKFYKNTLEIKKKIYPQKSFWMEGFFQDNFFTLHKLTNLQSLKLNNTNLLPESLEHLNQLNLSTLSINYSVPNYWFFKRLFYPTDRFNFLQPSLENLSYKRSSLKDHDFSRKFVQDLNLTKVNYLKKLDISDNKISSRVFQYFIQLTSLESLNLNYNKLISNCFFSSNIYENFNYLQHLKNLKELYLEDTYLNDNCMNFLNHLKALEVLNLNYNYLTEKSISIFKKLSELKELHLQENKINLSKLKKLKKNSKLKKLDISQIQWELSDINEFLLHMTPYEGLNLILTDFSPENTKSLNKKYENEKKIHLTFKKENLPLYLRKKIAFLYNFYNSMYRY